MSTNSREAKASEYGTEKGVEVVAYNTTEDHDIIDFEEKKDLKYVFFNSLALCC